MRGEKGVVLIVTLAVLLIASLLGASLVVTSRVNLRLSENSLLLLKARYAAQAGAEYVAGRIINGDIPVTSIGDLGSANDTGELVLDQESGQYYRVVFYKLPIGDETRIYIRSFGFVKKDGRKLSERVVEYVLSAKGSEGLPFYYDYAMFADGDIKVTGSGDIYVPGRDIHTNSDFRFVGSGRIVVDELTYVGSYSTSGSVIVDANKLEQTSPVTIPNPLVDVDYWRDYVRSNYQAGKDGFYYISGDLTLTGGHHMRGKIIMDTSGGTVDIPINPNGKTYVFVDGDMKLSGSISWDLEGSPEIVIITAGKMKITGSVDINVDNGSLTFMTGEDAEFHGSASIRTGWRFNVLSNGDIKITGSVAMRVVKQFSLIANGDIKKTGSSSIRLDQWTPQGGVNYGKFYTQYNIKLLGTFER